MPLNHKEITLLLSELPLCGSKIQKVYQLEVHTLIFELYHPDEHFWQLYVEVGTQEARFHRISGPRYVHKTMNKGAKQRFNQYLSSHIEGMIIEKVVQEEMDRLFTFHLTGHQESLLLFFRFYSASKSNVIVTNSDLVIEDLLFRRPKVNEISGKTFTIEDRIRPSTIFTVREYPQSMSFNEYIESLFMGERKGETEDLLDLLYSHYEKQKVALMNEKEQIRISLQSTSNGLEYKNIADLLSSNAHFVKKGMDSITLTDLEDTIQIPLNPLITCGENISSYYTKYHKEKNKREYLEDSLNIVEKKILAIDEKMKQFVSSSTLSVKELRVIYSSLEKSTSKRELKYSSAPGLYIYNGKFDILVGRNAQENEDLLKKFTKGNDYWMHTRDVSGGYIFIKYIKDKSVDLETILDAGNLAILFSKAKTYEKADIYFTQVKYLKRVKGGKKGVVLPTHEKTYTIVRDEKRIANLYEMQSV